LPIPNQIKKQKYQKLLFFTINKNAKSFHKIGSFMIFLIQSIFLFPLPLQSYLFVKENGFILLPVLRPKSSFLINLSQKKQGFLPFLNYLC
jgi:hypothetical protein